ncbi:MAG: LysM peptidoglycan-binding domain-containing protein [Clostridium sp.]|nr:LysM peptidoglycan-binding domain-containing protein [Clostridium sp.]MCM1209713.1 LysM peptidoglycan-binding domain-containing protein [Ruminococcus sp.]
MNYQNIICFIHNNHRKLIIGLSVLLITCALFFGASGLSNKVSASTHNEKYFKCIDIERDDTLWSIAEEYMTEEYASIDEYIEEVKSINALKGDKLYNGATLIVPYYAASK